MEYICIQNGNKIDVMRELADFTNSGLLVDKTFDFILKHKEILESEESIMLEKKVPKIRCGEFMNYVSLDAKYSINIRKSLIILVMLLLDASLTKGAVTTLAGMAGKISQTFYMIDDKERCLLLDLLINKKSTIDVLMHHETECVQNDIKCPYRDRYICKRGELQVQNLVNELVEKQIIVNKSGRYSLAF
ncbi:hypothetical protein [Cellulosilyticum sp. I15G10I2]|uniref:hypothetical protein n=1 Tax=Cellulosilyticum sp. I15G10I2 TaxID=1892843 RepID=UPI00085BFA1D|nr:hypothetical protein [Cellulosilyticum sp. I15G10I2]